MRWTDINDIAIELTENHPDVDPLTVNFVDLRDAGDPVEQAQAYDAAGADELCFLDLIESIF